MVAGGCSGGVGAAILLARKSQSKVQELCYWYISCTRGPRFSGSKVNPWIFVSGFPYLVPGTEAILYKIITNVAQYKK